MEHEIVAGLAQDESFVDGAMPPDAASLFKDPSSRPDYAVAVEGKGEGGAGGEQQWLRPEEKVVAGQRPSAELFLEEVCGGNVVQGTMDDRWFLGALAAVAAHPAGLLDNLFVSCDHWKTHGVITSRFFKDGEWLEVVVDTLEVAAGVVELLPDALLSHQRRPKMCWNFIHHTRHTASRTIFFDIFESPVSRSVNRIGTSVNVKFLTHARNFSSI